MMNKKLVSGFIIAFISGVMISNSLVEIDNELHIRKEIKDKEISKAIEEEKMEVINSKLYRESETFYYNEEDISMMTNRVNEEAIEKMLEGTELESLSGTFLDLERKYGVNAIFMASLACVESEYGTNNMSKEYNNITNIKDNNGNPRHFNSKYECLEATYRLLSRHYIDPHGDYYTGGNIYRISKIYCPDDDYNWVNNVNIVMEKLVSRI